jgi:predicted acyltransferase
MMALADSLPTEPTGADARLPPAGGRVPAIDRLRGVLVLLSALALLAPGALREWPENAGSRILLGQLQPSPWHGLSLADLVPAGFLFVLGFAATLSVARRRRDGQSAAAILAHLLWRCAALFAIGLVLDGGLLSAWPEVRWLGPWQQIALCNLCVGGLCLVADWKLLLPLALLILLNYALAFELFPADHRPAAASGARPALRDPYSNESNVAARMDQALLPGRKYFGTWDPRGLLTTFPALAVTLLGAAAGECFRQSRGWLPALIGAALINAGYILAEWQPLNAWLLTPPFVLIATGIWGLAGVALGSLPELFGRNPGPAASAEDLPERSRPAGKGAGFSVSALGRSALPTMVALGIASRWGAPAVSWLAGKTGIPRLDFQTITAVSGVFVLGWWMAWLSRRNWSRRDWQGSL